MVTIIGFPPILRISIKLRLKVFNILIKMVYKILLVYVQGVQILLKHVYMHSLSFLYVILLQGNPELLFTSDFKINPNI